MKKTYTVINECNVIQYYEQQVEANSEDEAIEIAEDWDWGEPYDEQCDWSDTYIGK